MTTAVDFRPGAVDVQGYAGDTLSFRVTVVDPTQVEGGVWEAQIRMMHTGPVVGEFDIVMEEEGSATLTLDAAATAEMRGFAGYWDIQVVFEDTTVRSLVRGKLNISHDITRGGADWEMGEWEGGTWEE